jgi:hypothetical protein
MYIHSYINLYNNVIYIYIYIYQWTGLRENLQETIDFPIKYGAFL